MAPLIEAENVHKTYVVGKNTLHILRGVCLSVEPGEAVAVVGASGAGKSTLLHILGGLDSPDRGTVKFKSRDMFGIPRGARTAIRAQGIGFVFQAYHLFPELDVIENTILPAMTGFGQARSMAAMRKKGMELLRAVGLDRRADHRPMELSGGEQQRLALARALMNDPEIVLADEPTGNLDDETGRQVLDHVFSLTTERGHALVMVTHNEKVAARCHRVLHLTDGIIASQPGPGR